MEKDDAGVGFGGRKGEPSAWDGLWGGPVLTEGEGAACEGFEFAGGEVCEGCVTEIGVGNVLVKDVVTEEEGPETAEVCRCVEALACLARMCEDETGDGGK